MPKRCGAVPTTALALVTPGPAKKRPPAGHGAGHPRYIRIKRSLVDDFAFCDEISFRLGLSVQPLHGRCTERDARNKCQDCFGLCMHDTCPLLNKPVKPLALSGRPGDV